MRVRGASAIPVLIAIFLPFLIGLSVHRQGFNLLDDGLWLLGTRVIVEGGHLYGDVFSIYGPARYLLLAPFFLVLGQSALTLAVFKAVLDGAAAGFGLWYTRGLGAGRWSWLVPVGVVAFGPVHPRYFAAALFAALVGRLLTRPSTRRSGIMAGLAWGGLCLFGLDMAGYGAVILLAGWLMSRRLAVSDGSGPRLNFSGIALGMGGVLGVGVLVCLAAGIFQAAFWDTVVYPLTRFGHSMGVSWFESFRGDALLHQPFSGQFTGEVLPGAWAGHAWQRATAFRAMFLLAWVIPVALLWFLRRCRDPRLGPLAALVISGWVTLLARGDVYHLRLIWFAALLVVPVLISRWPGGTVARGTVAVGFLLMVAGPLAVEKVWLAVNLERPGLVRWERESAGIHLAEKRAETLETVCADIPWDGRSPVLVWPVQPGLQFVLGAPLATSQATLLGGEVRSIGAIITELEDSRPTVAILGSARGLVSGAADTRGLEPDLWAYLRRRFILLDEGLSEGEFFLTATRASESAEGSLADSSEARLPGTAQQVTSGTSPAVGPGMTVAQSFPVEDFDLGGVELIFRSPGPHPYPVSFIVTFTLVGGVGRGRQLLQFPFNVSLEERTKKIRFSFSPLSGTNGRTVLMEITGHPEGTRPFSLLWNKATEQVPVFVDYCPEGHAFFNRQPIEADLYFVTF